MTPNISRRNFLRASTIAGTLVGTVPLSPLLGALVGCSESVDPNMQATLDLATDRGVLNYAYALTQLEGDFYIRVFTYPYPGMAYADYVTMYYAYYAAKAQVTSLVSMIPAGRITDAVLFRSGETVNFADAESLLPALKTIADTVAGGYAGLVEYATAAETKTAIADLAAAAEQRAEKIDVIGGGAQSVVTALTPIAVMERLQPFYITRFTVRNA